MTFTSDPLRGPSPCTICIRLALSLSLTISTYAQTVQLLHRVYHKDIPLQSFSQRAALDPVSLQLTPSSDFRNDIAQLYELAKGHRGALYQLALQRDPGAVSDDDLDIAAVKACHIPFASADILTLHLDDAGAPFHIDYYLDGVPHSGACPSKKQLNAFISESAQLLSASNTTVRVRRAEHPPLPELRMPPPLSPEGQPVQPPQEKSFVQKYWVYMVIGLVGLLLAGGPAEEEGAPAGGGGAPARR